MLNEYEQSIRDSKLKQSSIVRRIMTIDEIIADETGEKRKECPIDIGVIPNYMGINLCAVDSIEWTKQKSDNQLISVTINFFPATNLD